MFPNRSNTRHTSPPIDGFDPRRNQKLGPDNAGFCGCDLDRDECRKLFLALPLISPIWCVFSPGFAEIAKVHAVDVICERGRSCRIVACPHSLLIGVKGKIEAPRAPIPEKVQAIEPAKTDMRRKWH